MTSLLTRNAFISRTSKHTGAIKALQFNAFRSELLATVGAKGELFISDLNNVGNPFRMGNAVARADDFDCLDWNKRTAHIMATGSNGGNITVWDVKNKRESLTLKNFNKQPVSAIAWDPVKTTRLITAVPADTEPVILVWDLRNANAPEKILRGHDGGVLSLSWCYQDSDLLLSCGKDNRNICWNPQTGESYGEFPVVTNWTFQTKWHMHNPSLVATASFDGKIAVQSIQNTKSESDGASGSQSQLPDDDDFFNRAQSQQQGPRFSLRKAPKWLERPCGASFGFGGKVVTFKASVSDTSKRSMIRLATFAIDNDIVSSTESFEAALKENNLASICEHKIADAKLDGESADWKVITTLISKDPKQHIIEHLGFKNQVDRVGDGVAQLDVNGSKEEISQVSDHTSVTPSNRLSAFFDNSTDSDNFLAELAATKGAKTNNPFQLYTGSETDLERRITRALILGDYEQALDCCLQENRISDAFMIAICGGQRCIEKAQKFYFSRKSEGPNYLRLLASVVGKNLWDLVHNADLEDWKDIMATLCTYADTKDFPDLCEALGDRLDEHQKDDTSKGISKKDALFCYLVGSKLEKVVAVWIAEMEEEEGTVLHSSSEDSSFSVHARSLQHFIEKVTVFREIIRYQDVDRNSTSNWKLAALYDKYTEYADIASAHGQLKIAERYLDLLPSNYPAAQVAKGRVQQATKKFAPQTPQNPVTSTARTQTRMVQPDFPNQETNVARSKPSTVPSNPYAPPSVNKATNPYAPSNGLYGTTNYGNANNTQPMPYQTHGQQQLNAQNTVTGYPAQNLGPPRNMNASPSVPPPSKATNMSNWNDTPEDFFKAPASRRGTPVVSTNPPPIPYQSMQQPSMGSSFGPPGKSVPPVGPPPKGPSAPSPGSAANPPNANQHPERPSSAANAYAPPQSSVTLPVQQHSTIPRGPSPYNSPPSTAPASNRYAPTQPFQPDPPSIPQPSAMPTGALGQGPPPANPYAPQQKFNAPQQSASTPPPPPPPPQQQQQPPSMSASSASHTPLGPSQQQSNKLGTNQSQRKFSLQTPKYRESLLHVYSRSLLG